MRGGIGLGREGARSHRVAVTFARATVARKGIGMEILLARSITRDRV
jgi:hypothetical protein